MPRIVPLNLASYVDVDIPAIDLDVQEIEVLRRYESVYCAFVGRNILRPLTRLYTVDDVGKNIQSTILDFSTCHALLGSSYISSIQMSMQYTVLQSALLLTITMNLYITIPSDFEDEKIIHLFSGLAGGSAFTQLSVIIGCVIFSALLNRPYCPVDAMLARVQGNLIFVLITVGNYIAIALTIASMMVAGFNRSYLDGAVQLYAVLLICALIILFVISFRIGSKYQDLRALAFYNKYCAEDGRLKDEYLKLVYEPITEDSV